jgi:hypothetical protein
MTDPLPTFTLPLSVKTRGGGTVEIVAYRPGDRQPWLDDSWKSYYPNGRYLSVNTEHMADIVSGLPSVEYTIQTKVMEVNAHRTVYDARKVIIASTIVGHIGIMCAGSLLVHAIGTAQYVYWIHDLIWPEPWVTVAAEAAQ